MEVPGWFTSEFFEKALRREKGAEDISVKLKDVSRTVNAGTNYSSTLYRVTLVVSGSREVSLVVKTPPSLRFLKEHVVREGVFQKEAKMYREILPSMRQVALERGSGLLSEPLAAGAYDSPRRHAVIMDDLAAQGMSTVDQRRGLDHAHCLVSLRALARFHALSAAVLEQSPGSLDDYLEGYFVPERRDEVKACLDAGFAEMASLVETWHGFEDFAPRLRVVGGAVCDVVIRSRDVGALELPVLTHGEFWAGNLMFGYRADSGKVCKARFVDFQSCRLGSPVLDLHCFLTTSPCDAVRAQGTGDLLKAYHEEMCRAMRTVGCGHRVITLDQLRRDVEDSALYSLLVACTFLNMVLAEPGDLDHLTEENLGPAVDRTRSNPAYRERVQKLLLALSDDGLL
ncbi:uncharacterized protein LOC134532602 [Bacillus rossius redtenbacheri]|uniref:uncharacterized protein LOC134532602 n=1 Tax=Bacillus rossius redtenbacheri TaxID=93214 RepID=UPI002FDD0AF2